VVNLFVNYVFSPYSQLRGALDIVKANVGSSFIVSEVGLWDDYVNFYPSNTFFGYMDFVRNPFLNIEVEVECNNGEKKSYLWSIIVKDANTASPIFVTTDDIFLDIQFPWSLSSPLNPNPILVSDSDYLESNARLSFRLEPESLVSFVAEELWTAQAIPDNYTYSLNLYLDPEAALGEHSMKLFVTDGKHETELSFTLLYRENIFAPEFLDWNGNTAAYYTGFLSVYTDIGDTLPSVQVSAYDPDSPGLGTAGASLKINNSPYFEVTPGGRVVLIDHFPFQEYGGKIYVLEIEATEVQSEPRKSRRTVLLVDVEVLYATTEAMPTPTPCYVLE